MILARGSGDDDEEEEAMIRQRKLYWVVRKRGIRSQQLFTFSLSKKHAGCNSKRATATTAVVLFGPPMMLTIYDTILNSTALFHADDHDAWPVGLFFGRKPQEA